MMDMNAEMWELREQLLKVEAELSRVQSALDSQGKHPAAPHEGVWVWIGRAVRAEERLDELGELDKLRAEGWGNNDG
jgi:hypothetical protein